MVLSFIMSVQNVSTGLPLDRVVSNFVLEIFMKSCEKNSNLVKFVQKYQAPYMKI